VDSVFVSLKAAFSEERLVGVATVLGGARMGQKLLLRSDGAVEGDWEPDDLRSAVVARAKELLDRQETASFAIRSGTGEEGEEVEVFFESYPPPEKLIIVGAVHVAIPLVSIASTLGFHTIVVDPRTVYASRERFPHADELIVQWPSEALSQMHLHESTYCVFLTHDPKLDNPALVVALRSKAGYVGALGSRRTHAKRVDALAEMGLGTAEIARIHAPIGIPLGGRRPEEIALSIVAEITAARYGDA